MQNDSMSQSLWTPYIQDTPFKFNVSAFNRNISKTRQRDVIESFNWMDYKGEIRMAGPELEVGVLEDYFAPSPEPGDLRGIWIGRKVPM